MPITDTSIVEWIPRRLPGSHTRSRRRPISAGRLAHVNGQPAV